MKKKLRETKKQINKLKDLTKKEKKELFEGLKEIEKLPDDFNKLKNENINFGDYFLDN